MMDWQITGLRQAGFRELLVEDVKVRAYIKKRYGRSGIAKIRIERTREKVVFLSSRCGSHDHRQEGTGSRKLTKELKDLILRESRSRRSRSTARGGRPARGRGHRRAAGETAELPPHHEAHHDQTMEGGAKASASSWPAGSAVRNGPQRKKPWKAAFRSRLAAKIDYGFCEAKTGRAISASRCGSTTVIFSTPRTTPIPSVPRR